MATGVKPRDEESQITRADLELLQDAMKNKKFREMLSEYCDEVRDPANQAIYQKEMTQLEKERGYDITFINPKKGYVIKTSVAGDRKAFINICSNENVEKPSCTVQEVNGQKGMNWKLPYTIIPPREDYDNKKLRCVIYDVVFHPDTLRMAEVNKRFRELLNKTAFDGLQRSYNIHLDSNNCRFPKSYYKGMTVPAVIRKEDPDYVPPTDDEAQQMSPDILDKLYPQHTYPEETSEPVKEDKHEKPKNKTKNNKNEFTHSSEHGYTVPKHVVKQQKNVDFQDYTYDKDSKQYSAIPSHIVVEIYLPLLSSTKHCVLDVREKSLSLISENPAKYKLSLTLPYAVNDECGSATFDKSKHMLIVSLPVIRNHATGNINLKVDSGVESEENSGSQSEEDTKENLVEEISSNNNSVIVSPLLVQNGTHEEFLQPSIGYTLPPYTHNVMDDIVAFTFHVKNTEPDSVSVKNIDNKVYIKFTSVGSGFVPVHYAAIIIFEENIKFDNVTGEAWDNNVILQLELLGDAPQHFQIGLNKESMKYEQFDIAQVKKLKKEPDEKVSEAPQEEPTLPVVEVTNLGTETNIVVSSNNTIHEVDVPENNDIVWTDLGYETSAKSILRKPMAMMRSFSESSVGDVASSMDYISSDCIPEESSLKKTVRFNDVIARQFYRYNSSIEGQKKKNQRRKSKKRNQDRRRSESEAEDDSSNTIQSSKPRLKSVLKQRRDSGLADTSDAEEYKTIQGSEPYNETQYDENENVSDRTEAKGKPTTPRDIENSNRSPRKSKISLRNKDSSLSETEQENKVLQPVTCDNIKHNTHLYNPDKLNKGQYQEVTFKNDLIFDLDM